MRYAVPTVTAAIPPTGEAGFQLRLDRFEGPLDLLLRLIEQEELDITTVSLVQVTDQYLNYLRSAAVTDFEALADFIAIAAKLIFLKSRALLPRQPDEEPDEAYEAVGEDLARQLQEYRLFKLAAGSLKDIQEAGLRAYPRSAPPPDVPLPLGLDGVTLDLLTQIFRETLERQPAPKPSAIIHRQDITVDQKIEEITWELHASGRLSFRTIMQRCRSRVEVIVSFLAVLELIKKLSLRAEQDAAFADIVLVRL